MKIDASTKIADLLDQYPFLENFLVTVSPKFKSLKNPMMRKTIGKVASLKQVAAIGGIPLERLLKSLSEEIARHTDNSVPAPPLEKAPHEEILPDPSQRQEALQQIGKEFPSQNGTKSFDKIWQSFSESWLISISITPGRKTSSSPRWKPIISPALPRSCGPFMTISGPI